MATKKCFENKLESVLLIQKLTKLLNENFEKHSTHFKTFVITFQHSVAIM